MLDIKHPNHRSDELHLGELIFTAESSSQLKLILTQGCPQYHR